MKNLLKCPRGVNKSAELYESVLDSLEKTEAGIPQAQEDVRFEDYSMVYVIPVESVRNERQEDFTEILHICQRYSVNAWIELWQRSEFGSFDWIDQHKTTFMYGRLMLCLFIERLPSGIPASVRFIIKLMNAISKEFRYTGGSIYRFDRDTR